MKKALITGFTGQVGSQMADFLLENTDYEDYSNKKERRKLYDLMGENYDT